MKKEEYLNSVLISRFYLQTIHKTKNTTKIIIIKIKKVKKYKDKERRISYLLICWKLQSKQ
jgi:hypothetical protein